MGMAWAWAWHGMKSTFDWLLKHLSLNIKSSATFHLLLQRAVEPLAHSLRPPLLCHLDVTQRQVP